MDSADSPDLSVTLARHGVFKIVAGDAILGLTALVALVGAAPDLDRPPSPVPGSDESAGDRDGPCRTRARNAFEWGDHLAQYGTLSLAASGLALGRTQDLEVRAFASAEIAEQRALVGVLGAIGTDVPADLDPAFRATLRAHETATGRDFDRIYVEAQLRAHGDLLALMASLLRNARRGDRTESIAKGVAHIATGTIREHLALAERLAARLEA